MATAMTRSVPKVVLIPLKSIVESSSNPRKTFTGIEELAADVGMRGILQPILLREKDGRYELVFGARRFRAAKLAGLPDIPAFIRELTDEQSLEVQIVENTQREDVHPLEEADGYRRLHEEFKYSIEEIAAKVGKSRSAIYERIKLCALVQAGREAFFDGKLSASTALLVARIPDKELQDKAVKDVVGTTFHRGEPMSYREAVDHVQRTYMLQLKDAPFDITDAELVPKAGACSACPKRTGNQRELFGDVKSPNVCTDPKCYQGKADALWTLRVANAKETGLKVIDGAEAKKLFPYGDRLNSSEFKKLTDEEYVGGSFKSVKTILGKEAAPTAIARTPDGKVVELVRADLVRKALKERQPTRSRESSGRSSDSAERRKLEIRKKVVAATMDQVILGAKTASDEKVWRFFVHTMLTSYGYVHVDARAVETRRKLSTSALRSAAKEYKADSLRALAVELVASHSSAGSMWSGYGEGFKAAAQIAGVDLKKVEAQLAAEKKAAKGKKAAKSAACAIPGCGEPGKRTKDAPGLWCADHGKKLSIAEKKSIHARSKRLAARA